MLNSKKLVLAIAGSALLLPILTGCSGQSAPMTKDEQTNFKGGQMPDAARKQMDEARQKAASSQAAPQGNR